jgi:serralysin
MPVYSLTEDENFSDSNIGLEMFGTNYVTNFDFEFVEGSGALDILGELGVTVLRFPGGSATEASFSDASFVTGDWDVDIYTDASGTDLSLTTLQDFFAAAGIIGANVQLVIPTRVAFDQSAGQALIAGNYGERTELNSNYFAWLDSYLEEAFREAQANGIEITLFEIGNEFWGSGQMSAAEYGNLAAEVTAYLGEVHPEVDVIIQVVSSTNEYSPLRSRAVFLEPTANGNYIVHANRNNEPGVSENWLQVTMPGQGSVGDQIEAIAIPFSNNSAALRNLHGVLDHVYFDAGFAGIDSQRDFALIFPSRIFEILVAPAELVQADPLAYYVTEWSPRNVTAAHEDLDFVNATAAGNANGLQLAHTTIEAFFELASNGVDAANFWPLTFGNPSIDTRVLIDTSDLDLTFSGRAFQFLAESVIGLRPILDFEIAEEIDIHGFGVEARFVFFVGERSGQDRPEAQTLLNFSEFALREYYFVNLTTMSSGDGSYDNVDSNPLIMFHDGFVQNGELLSVELDAWDMIRVELQEITNGNDELFGRDGDDNILGFGGDDLIGGGRGSDILNGGGGLDTAIFDGERADYVVTQSPIIPTTWYVAGGEDTDTLQYFEAIQFDDKIIFLATVNGNGLVIFGRSGDDSLFGNNGNDIITGGRGNDSLYGGAGYDQISAYSGRNELVGGEGRDFLIGGTSSDTLDGGAGFDLLRGDASSISGGSDTLIGGTGNDLLMGGVGRDTFIFAPQDGVDLIAHFEIEDANYLESQNHFQTSTGSDFQPAIDVILLEGFESVNDTNVMSFVEAGRTGAIFSAEGTIIRFYGIELGDLSAADFEFS